MEHKLIKENISIVNGQLGICELCKQKSILENSHIIPKFIFDWHKKTSVTGRFRYGENINKPVQDGLKLPLLCNNCEQKLSKWENYFRKNIFHPTAQRAPIIYDKNFMKFSVSLSWRALVYFYKENQISCEILLDVENALEIWRKFLLDAV